MQQKRGNDLGRQSLKLFAIFACMALLLCVGFILFNEKQPTTEPTVNNSNGILLFIQALAESVKIVAAELTRWFHFIALNLLLHIVFVLIWTWKHRLPLLQTMFMALFIYSISFWLFVVLQSVFNSQWSLYVSVAASLVTVSFIIGRHWIIYFYHE